MLTRVLLAIVDIKRREKIRRSIASPDVVVDAVKKSRDLWERLSRESGDFIVVDRELIPAPIADTVRILRNAPESPDLVVITKGDDAVNRSRLLAAGCDTVLPQDIPAEVLSEIFSSICRMG